MHTGMDASLTPSAALWVSGCLLSYFHPLPSSTLLFSLCFKREGDKASANLRLFFSWLLEQDDPKSTPTCTGARRNHVWAHAGEKAEHLREAQRGKYVHVDVNICLIKQLTQAGAAVRVKSRVRCWRHAGCVWTLFHKRLGKEGKEGREMWKCDEEEAVFSRTDAIICLHWSVPTSHIMVWIHSSSSLILCWVQGFNFGSLSESFNLFSWWKRLILAQNTQNESY